MKVQRMIRKDGFKLIFYPRLNQLLLFDLKKDPEEIKDISESNPEKVQALFKDLITLQKEMKDKLDLQTYYDALYLSNTAL